MVHPVTDHTAHSMLGASRFGQNDGNLDPAGSDFMLRAPTLMLRASMLELFSPTLQLFPSTLQLRATTLKLFSSMLQL
jgi:hypothetical protein